MQLGAYKLSAIHTGFLWLDGGSMFGTVPRIVWEKQNPPDSKHRIQLAMRALLIEGNGKRILVDCGLGDKGGEKFKEMFNVDQDTHSVEKSLGEKGLHVGDITDVILSHLHFDHAGGATKLRGDGTYAARFPNATYYVQSKNLEVAQNPNPRERVSYLKEIYEALLQENRLTLVNGNVELFPGIEVWVSQGHTEAQQHVKVSDGKTTLFYGGDLIPTQTHVPLAWVMGYDLHPLTMIKEKSEVFSWSEKSELILFYEHDPKVSATKIVKDKRGFVVGEVVNL